LQSLGSVQLHIERIDMDLLDAADGFGRFPHSTLCGFGETFLGRSNHLNNLLGHSLLLSILENCTRFRRGSGPTGKGPRDPLA
jgi:hypothetical protein